MHKWVEKYERLAPFDSLTASTSIGALAFEVAGAGVGVGAAVETVAVSDVAGTGADTGVGTGEGAGVTAHQEKKTNVSKQAK